MFKKYLKLIIFSGLVIKDAVMQQNCNLIRGIDVKLLIPHYLARLVYKSASQLEKMKRDHLSVAHSTDFSYDNSY